jgi:hypothetical protein
MVGVSVTVGVSDAGGDVLVGVAERYALVCMTDQVLAARVSGSPGVWMTVLETRSHDMLKRITIKNNNPILKSCLSIIPPLIDPLTLV